MMRACRTALDEGNSIMVFPEGTRSPTGQMRRFKTGAFEIAKENGRPILPIVLQGTANALPKRGFVLQGRHPITIRVLDEVPVESFADASAEELTERVRAVIAAHLDAKEAPASVVATSAR
jgi:1-acyl-sn-glycerol-3-phosphate acyltransferase